MSNSVAVYRDPVILALVSKWFEDTYGVSASSGDGYLMIVDLYQSFSEYTIGRQFAYQRLNIDQFAKCLVACKIIDIGGRFRVVPTYQPSNSAITRAKA